MRVPVVSSVFLVGALVLPALSRGASIVQTVVTDPQAVPFVDDLQFQGFDPRLGTLTAVTISGHSTTSGEIDVTNISRTGALSFSNATSSIPISITDPSGAQINTSAQVTQSSGTVVAGQTNSYTGLSSVESFTPLNVPQSAFAYYLGSPVVNIYYNSSAGTFGGNGPAKLAFGGDAFAYSTVTLEYDYTPNSVPLPSVAFAVVAPAVAMGLWSLRRAMLGSQLA